MSKKIPTKVDLQNMSRKDIVAAYKEFKEYLSQLKLRNSLRELNETHIIKQVKKALARICFYMNNPTH